MAFPVAEDFGGEKEDGPDQGKQGFGGDGNDFKGDRQQPNNRPEDQHQQGKRGA